MLILAYVLSFTSWSQVTIEGQCRAKAKEAAREVYMSCLDDSKEEQLESVRQEYEEKLRQLKADYHGELEKIQPASESESPPSQMDSAPLALRLRPEAKSQKSAKSTAPPKVFPHVAKGALPGKKVATERSAKPLAPANQPTAKSMGFETIETSGYQSLDIPQNQLENE